MGPDLAPQPPQPLTEAQAKARRKRSIALGVLIAALAVLFYAITVFKMGAGVMKRPL